MQDGILSNGQRKYSASGGIPRPGSFTRGNANSMRLGREWTSGLLATVGNPAGAPDPKFFRPAEKSAATKRAERVEKLTLKGAPCPGCGMRTSVPKTCFCW